mmetsp:Transcript_39819/g.33647  ORF Transcript_39819/g.33647 Transcript_39819/m.33647 type:complete len:181 (+) Transcript_39819:493-1035(+)
MFIRLCKKENVKTIALVRNASQISDLIKLGATIAFNTEDKDFDKNFTASLIEHECGNFFECVGGDAVGKIFSLLLPNSTMHHYGNLKGEGLTGLNTSDFIFHNKVLKGFWLGKWIKSINMDEMTKWLAYVSKSFESQDGLFSTEINNEKTYELEDIKSAVIDYTANMSKGKILLRPHKNT